MGVNHKVTFTAYFNGSPKTYEVKGRDAETLIWLLRAGEAGITALEVSSWAYRLSSYIHHLRHEYGLEIRTIMEPHDGGKHARYVLITIVVIIPVEARDGKASS